MNFATWWDTTKGTATPETYAGWEESCRQAWHAALENSVLESARIAELERQRDALLEALQFVMSAHGEQLDLAFQQARDAIKAAGGGK